MAVERSVVCVTRSLLLALVLSLVLLRALFSPSLRRAPEVIPSRLSPAIFNRCVENGLCLPPDGRTGAPLIVLNPSLPGSSNAPGLPYPSPIIVEPKLPHRVPVYNFSALLRGIGNPQGMLRMLRALEFSFFNRSEDGEGFLLRGDSLWDPAFRQSLGASPSGLAVFLHIGLTSAYSRTVAQSLLRALQFSGLLLHARLFVGVVGNYSLLPALPAGATVVARGGAGDFEFPTLRALLAHARAHPDDRVLYLHTKGPVIILHLPPPLPPFPFLACVVPGLGVVVEIGWRGRYLGNLVSHLCAFATCLPVYLYLISFTLAKFVGHKEHR